MMKFLRQHNRKILAVVTAFILVSWLIGAPLYDLLSPNPAKEVVGAAFGKTVTNGDLTPSANTTIILGSLGVDWRLLAGAFAAPEDQLKVEHWFLLVREATRAGINVPDSDVDDFLNPQRFPPQLLDMVRKRDHVSTEQIRAAVREFLKVQQYGREALDVYEPADHEVRHFVRDTQDKISVRMVVFRAKDFLDESESVDPAEVAAQFEKARDKLPSKSEDGYGYRFPHRVRVQYLAARLSDVMAAVTLTEDEVRRNYRKLRNDPDYSRFELEDDTTTQPSTAPFEGPTTAATQPEPRKILVRRPMPYEEARPRVEEMLKKRIAATRIRDAMQRIAADLARPLLAVTPGADGFKEVPESVRDRAYFSAARERLEKQYGIPLTYVETDLLTRDEAAELEGIGKAVSVGEGKDRLTFAEYAFRLPGVFDASKAGETALRLALYQPTDPPIHTENGNQPEDYYIFRVVELQEPRAPATLDEVRGRVERDIREMHAYARAERRAREFLAEAMRMGIDAAFQAATDLHDPKYHDAFSVKLTPAFPRRESMFQAAGDREEFVRAALAGEPVIQPPRIAELGVRSADFVDRCFEMTSPLWSPPSADVPAATEPATTAPADEAPHKVTLIPLPRERMVVVAALADANLVRSDAYQNQYYTSSRQLLMTIRREVLKLRWFNPDEIERRCGFVREKTADGQHVPITHERRPLTPPEF